MNTNNAKISDDISDIPGLKIRSISPIRFQGAPSPTLPFIDVTRVKAQGVRVDLERRTVKAFLGDSIITVRAPQDVFGILGSKANDRIQGTSEPDFLVGKAGKDVIQGLGNSDVLGGERAR